MLALIKLMYVLMKTQPHSDLSGHPQHLYSQICYNNSEKHMLQILWNNQQVTEVGVDTAARNWEEQNEKFTSHKSDVILSNTDHMSQTKAGGELNFEGFYFSGKLTSLTQMNSGINLSDSLLTKQPLITEVLSFLVPKGLCP